MSNLNLPQWKCHKVVGAAKIAGIKHGPDGSALVLELPPSGFLEGSGTPVMSVNVDADWCDKHEPQDGGYYVVYEDGYRSFSPSEAFEKGYTRIDDASGRAPKWPLPASKERQE